MANCAFDKTLAGKSLADITRARGREVNFENAAETLLEIQHSGGCRPSITRSAKKMSSAS